MYQKNFLLTRQNNCPIVNCTAIVKPVVPEQRFSVTSSQSTTPSLVERMSKQIQVNSPVIHEEVAEVPGQEMDVDVEVGNKKRTNEATDSSSNKKSKKHARLEDSNVLKKLIRELSIGVPIVSEVRKRESLFRASQQEGDTHSFLSLYCKIINAEGKLEVSGSM